MTILKLKGKIKSMECINPITLDSCKYLWIGSVFGIEFVPYYCDLKEKEVVNPDGKRKCKDFG